MAKPTITALRIQSGTQRTAYCEWSWSKTHVDYYRVIWYYYTGDGVAFVGNDSNTDFKQSTYTAPDNAVSVSVKVRPVSRKHTVNKKSVYWWTASWSTLKTLNIRAINITSPTSGPDVSISSKLRLSATISGMTGIETQAVFRIQQRKSGKWELLKDITSEINGAGRASAAYDVAAGYPYRVYVKGKRGKLTGVWSPPSDTVEPAPLAPKSFVSSGTYARSATSIRLEWTASALADSYEVEYAVSAALFNRSTSEVHSVTITDGRVAVLTGLDTGRKWFFRVKAINEAGSSAWLGGTSKDYIFVGAKPAAPTTWSETSSAVAGDIVNLHFTHNTRDDSPMTSYKIEYTVRGTTTTRTVTATGFSGYYAFDTTNLNDQDQIKWRICTAGATQEYSAWSATRTVTVYQVPTLSMILTDGAGDPVDPMTSFPLVISATPGPATQTPMGYDLRIIAESEYTTTDDMGEEITVPEGSVVFQRVYNTGGEDLDVELSAGDVALENNVEYTVTCLVAMNTGMTASAEETLSVEWADDVYEPDAQLTVDMETLAASINPYCVDENEDLVENIVLSVYRREYDGTFTLIAADVENSDSIFVTDPHPSLDFARYRIVAKSTTTGQIAYSDLQGQPVGVTDIVIQWDEAWKAFDTTSEDALEETAWSGSMLRLPYNVDVSDSLQKDTSLIYYAGRENPVSYYGDGIKTGNSWKVSVPKDDSDTIYALRRLARYPGDVYVREPSGVGYWSNVEVSMEQHHLDLTVPVTLSVTKVEGGM